MSKTIIAGALSLGLLVSAIPALAQTTGTSNTATGTTNVTQTTGTTGTAKTADTNKTAKKEVKVSPVDSAAAVACLGTAVNSRETALVSAIGTYSSDTNSAYNVRAAALKTAYAQTGGTKAENKVIQTAVKSAWSTFNSSTKTARKNWQTARNKSWSDFRTAAKSCKVSAAVSDHSNSSSEVSGN